MESRKLGLGPRPAGTRLDGAGGGKYLHQGDARGPREIHDDNQEPSKDGGVNGRQVAVVFKDTTPTPGTSDRLADLTERS